jgi:hypothetical protein
MEASQELETLLAATGTAAAANYLLVLAEQLLLPGHEGGTAAAAAEGPSADGTAVGVVAIDAGSGDITYGLCSTSDSSSSMYGFSSSSSECGVIPLDSVLLSLSPADIVVCGSVSSATDRLLRAYMAGVASRKCRLERLWQQDQQQQDQQQQQQECSDSSGSYLDTSQLQQLVEFYSSSSTSDSSAGQAIKESSAAAEALAASNDDVRFVMSLPNAVLTCLCGAVTYLKPFGLSGVLRNTAGFRPLTGMGQEMMLDGNVLRQLEILAAGLAAGDAALVFCKLTSCSDRL